MAIALVSSRYDDLGVNGGTGGTLDTTGATLLVITRSAYSGGFFDGPTDSKGNSWTQAAVQDTGNISRVEVWYSIPTSVGSGHTITLGYSRCYTSSVFSAWSGTKATSPLDAVAGTFNTSGTTISPGSVTPAENNEVVISSLSQDNNASASTIDSGFTIVQGAGRTANALGIGQAYKIQTTAGAENPQWTTGTGNDRAAANTTFKSDGAGGGGVVIPALDGAMLVGGLCEMSGGLS